MANLSRKVEIAELLALLNDDVKPAKLEVKTDEHGQSYGENFKSYCQARWQQTSRRTKKKDISLNAQRAREILRTWVNFWLHLGRNSRKLMDTDPGLDREMQRFHAYRDVRTKVFYVDWSDKPEWPSRQMSPTLPIPDSDPKREACRLLLALLTDPEIKRFGKCTRRSCGRFFYSETRYSRKLYCSRSCANNARNQRPSVEEEERQKLQTVAKALKRIPKERMADWKRWLVATLAADSEISMKWLTMREKSGAITSPISEAA